MKFKEIHVAVRQPDELAADTGVPNVRHLKQIKVETPPEPEPTEPWHTPLQQMLDALKARVEPEAGADEEEVKALVVHAQPGTINENLTHPGVCFCRDCGALIFPRQLAESVGAGRVSAIRKAWNNQALRLIPERKECAIKHRI